jgi:hypothetical protein
MLSELVTFSVAHVKLHHRFTDFSGTREHRGKQQRLKRSEFRYRRSWSIIHISRISIYIYFQAFRAVITASFCY